MHSNVVGQGKQMNCLWLVIMFCHGNSNLKYYGDLFLLQFYYYLLFLSLIASIYSSFKNYILLCTHYF